jgi:hypothetical protein
MRYGLLFINLHVLHEQRVICPCRDDSDLDPVLWIPVEKLVIHIHLIKGVQVICNHKEKLSGSCGKYCPLFQTLPQMVNADARREAQQIARSAEKYVKISHHSRSSLFAKMMQTLEKWL